MQGILYMYIGFLKYGKADLNWYSKTLQDPFPLHAICGSVWKNVDGQLSFLRYAVSAPADMFTFAHSTRRLVSQFALGPENLCFPVFPVLFTKFSYSTDVRLMMMHWMVMSF